MIHTRDFDAMQVRKAKELKRAVHAQYIVEHGEDFASSR